MKQVSVVDYGAGNLGSVLRALRALGHSPRTVSTPSEVAASGRLVFPGVGAAGQAMASLAATGLDDALREHVSVGRPLLGICVGMQVLGESSEECDAPCLGILPFRLERFRIEEPVPHMGWNDLAFLASNPASEAASRGTPRSPDVYFVHSYFAPLTEASRAVALATTTYADVPFVSAVARGNVWGMQFHVEKSGRTGLSLIENFLGAF